MPKRLKSTIERPFCGLTKAQWKRALRRAYERVKTRKAAAPVDVCNQPGLPSAADLDAVCAERELVAKTGAVESYDMAITGVQD